MKRNAFMLRLFLLMAPLLAVLSSCSKDETPTTGTLTGIVYDANNRQPLRGVSVSISPQDRTTTTGDDGRFSFVELSPASYTVTASCSGYRTDKKTAAVRVGETATCDFSLHPAVPVLEVDKTTLDFGREITNLPFDISNTGYGPLTWQVSENASWMQCNPASGTLQPGQKASVTVTVSRSDLRIGSYTESIAVTSDGGSATLTVTMQVVGSHQPPTVETGAATDVQARQIAVTGRITDMGTEAGITQHGHVWSTVNQQPELTTAEYATKYGTLQQAAAYTSTFTGLQPHTLYYIRAYATNQHGTSYGQTITVTTLYGDVVLTTQSVTSVVHNAATSGGTITDLGGNTVTDRGLCWATTAAPTIADSHVSSGDTGNSFTARMTRLAELTDYYVRAYATAATGQTYYGQVVAFRTTHEIHLPQTSAVSVSSVGVYKATLRASLTNDGRGTVTDCGFVLATQPGPTTADRRESCGPQTGSFSTTLTDLKENTTYYVRAYATNEAGTNYGEEVQFTTLEITVPTVTATTVSGISFQSATFAASVSSLNNGTLQDAGFVYSTQPNPTLSDHKLSCGVVTSLQASTSVLQQLTTYYIRAYATNEKGTAYGPEATFTTKEKPHDPSFDIDDYGDDKPWK